MREHDVILPHLCCSLVEKGGDKVCETRVGGDVLLVLCEGLVVERVESCNVGHDQVLRVDSLESVV